ncbi:MAG TPA: TonB-dependent receptor [Thermoanaerobaculia bacterium]|nr:TonB-dependent receptor [Thermoanaerobaculia bacterium]
MRSICFTLFFLSIATLAVAQTASETIVVTASALPEKADETPVAATVITRADIERRAAHDVADVLREVPGLAVARTGAPGKSTTLFIRGGSSKQALVLWNGIEMNNPYFSGYNFGQLSTAGVEKVEVVRGPFSALYGSEAVSGVVNVLTTPSASGFTADVSGGENGFINGSLAGAYVGSGWTAHAMVEKRQDDGFDANDDFDSTSFAGGLNVTPLPNLSLGILARHNGYDLGIPRTPNANFDAFIASPNRREEGSETQLAIPVRYESGRMAYELRLSESRRTEDFNDPDGAFGPEFSATDSRTRGARATARTATPFGTITAGGEYSRDVVSNDSNFATIDDAKRTNKSLFVEDRLSLAPFEVTAGVRYDDYDTFGSEVSPRIAAAWVRNGHKIRAGYGEGFRAPAIGELYHPFGGNPELEAEQSKSYEVGYERFFTTGSASVTLFHSNYDNLIAFGSDFLFHNIASATAQGVELAASREFGALHAMISYTYTDTEDQATGETLVRRPRNAGSIAVGYDRGAVGTELVVAHTGARVDVTDLFPFSHVTNEAHTTADITVRYRLANLTPYVKLENATDERYEEVFGYPSARRRVIAGVRFSR